MTLHVSTNAGDPPPRVRIWADVEPYLAELHRAEAATKRYYLDDPVVSTGPRRTLLVQVPMWPTADLDEGVVRDRALLAARKQCDGPEVIAVRWLPADEIDELLQENGLRVAEVELLGTPRA